MTSKISAFTVAVMLVHVEYIGPKTFGCIFNASFIELQCTQYLMYFTTFSTPMFYVSVCCRSQFSFVSKWHRIIPSHSFPCHVAHFFPQAQTASLILNYSIVQIKLKQLMSQLTHCKASGGFLCWWDLFGGKCDALNPANISSLCVTLVMIYHCLHFDSLELLSYGTCTGSYLMLSTLVCYSWSVMLSHLLPWKLSHNDKEVRMKLTGSNPAHPSGY